MHALGESRLRDPQVQRSVSVPLNATQRNAAFVRRLLRHSGLHGIPKATHHDEDMSRMGCAGANKNAPPLPPQWPSAALHFETQYVQFSSVCRYTAKGITERPPRLLHERYTAKGAYINSFPVLNGLKREMLNREMRQTEERGKRHRGTRSNSGSM